MPGCLVSYCPFITFVEVSKGSFLSESLKRPKKYSKSLSWADDLNFMPITVIQFFKFSAQDSDLEYFFELHQTFWQKANFNSDFSYYYLYTILLRIRLTYYCECVVRNKTENPFTRDNKKILLDDFLMTHLENCRWQGWPGQTDEPTYRKINRHIDKWTDKFSGRY